MKVVFKTILSYISYVFILLGCYYLISEIENFTSPIIFVIKYSSYIIFLLGMLLSIRFNKGRVFLIILTLTLFQLFLSYYENLSIDLTTYSHVLYPLMCILIPINVTILSQLREKGIFSLWGKIRILALIVEMFAIYQIVLSNSQLMETVLSYNLTDDLLTKTNMPQISLFIFLLSIILFITKAYIKRSSFEVPLIGVTICLFAALYYIEDNLSFTIFLSAAGLMLVISIIEDSYSMAYLDELTGIPSRRALREDLMKLGNKYSIAMLDIDFFKKFNDKYGHDVGDDVLRLVASNLMQVSGGGKAFRYGGEEFTILFPGKASNDVVPHLEKLREQISKCGYTRKASKSKSSKSKQKGSGQLFVTISIGVCEKNNKFKDANDVIKGADKALYRAKKKGRNCVSK